MTRPAPHLLTVSEAKRISPNMIRVTLIGAPITRMSDGCEGANCKIYLPETDQSRTDFSRQLADGPRPVVRTYTVRHMRSKVGEMDIDFVDHGDDGPASAWARSAKPGTVCGFAGPGPVKLKSYYADSYLVAADMSALPVAAATLEAMPRDATGDAFFEILDPGDKQKINAPKGIRQHWIVANDHSKPGHQITDAIFGTAWPDGVVQTCIAGESGMIKALRQYICVVQALPKDDAYISGYWKLGLIEDEHQKLKRTEAVAA